MIRIAIVSRETFREHAASRRRERRAARIDSARYVGRPVGARVIDPAGHAVSYGHDQRGHVLSETHPDSGTATSSDTSLGEIASRLTAYDPGMPATTHRYDWLGCLTSRREPEMTSTWVWDTRPGD